MIYKDDSNDLEWGRVVSFDSCRLWTISLPVGILSETTAGDDCAHTTSTHLNLYNSDMEKSLTEKVPDILYILCV